jgi:hypothetical protein
VFLFPIHKAENLPFHGNLLKPQLCVHDSICEPLTRFELTIALHIRTFEDLGLCEQLAKTCHELGWKAPTEIQAQSIPYGLEGRDLIALAKTGLIALDKNLWILIIKCCGAACENCRTHANWLQGRERPGHLHCP